MSEDVTNADSEEVEAAPVDVPETEVVESSAGETSNTPWHSDLESTFEDPDVRDSVDQFLRAKIQPYITQLESAKVTNEAANQFIEDYKKDPLETFLKLSYNVFEEDVADQLIDYIDALFNGPDSDSESEGADEESNGDNLPPELKELVENQRAEKRAKEYQEFIDELKETHNEPLLTRENFSPFFKAADGDEELAIHLFRQFKKEFGGEALAAQVEIPEPSDVAAAVRKAAPRIIGDDTPGSATPPLDTQPKNLDEAYDQMMDMVRGS